jgi:4-amino-4-deoxy-L-arabinose transferase-like glycosyltransferase
MNPPPSPPPPLPRNHAAVLTLLSIALLLLALLPRELWSTDEPIVGAVVREMLVDGEWLVPHVNSAVYPDKPPLYYWLAALPVALTGAMTPLWLRLPAALAAIGCLWLTYALGARLMSQSTGLLAAVILATSPLFTVSAQIARMDMVLTLLITAIFYCFVRGLQEPAHQRRWFLAIYPLIGLTFLTKGLIGPIVAGFVIGSVLLWQRDWRAWRRIEPVWGACLAGAVVLPWLIPAVLQEGVGYAEALLITQSVGRAVNSFAHDRPFYYYLYTFPPVVLPWIVCGTTGNRTGAFPSSSVGWSACFSFFPSSAENSLSTCSRSCRRWR